MPLPIDFRFSQNNLQDFVDCPRRFELKYLLKQDWPALVSEPIQEFERLQYLGLRFHTLVQQHLAGISIDSLEQSIDNPDLIRWWKNYLIFIDQYINFRRLVEYPQIIHFCNYRLITKYDLLVFEEGGNAIILDWKTTRHRAFASFLEKKIQSLVYPFVLSEASKKGISHENIRMIYWFPEFPNEPEVFNYSTSQYKQTEIFLKEMIEDIAKRENGDYPLTDDERKCKYCIYRSLCDRGLQAGDASKIDEDNGLDSNNRDEVDFNEIEEIEF
jgi:CRISPR/Cas system-associated exonuclease Cas4 (RecB family)